MNIPWQRVAWGGLLLLSCLLVGCGSTHLGVTLHLSSVCSEWNTASLSERQGYASNVANKAEIPPGHYELGGVERYIEGQLSAHCQQVAQTNQATTLRLTAIVPMRSTASPTAPSEPGGPLHEVGTMTETDGKGTAVRLQYTLGPLGYSPTGTPPTPVLEACHEDYTTTIAQMAYSRGQMTASYTEGSLPAEISFGAEGAVTGTSTATKWNGSVAYDVEGQWKCPANEEAGTSVTFQPGETKTFPMWVLSSGLSNAEPRFPPAVVDGWEFTGVIVGNSPLEVTTSGPNSGQCEHKDVLMLYAKLPFSIEVESFGTGGNMVACRAV